MSSSRYRDDLRGDPSYSRHPPPSRDYYPPSSSSHPYDSRPPFPPGPGGYGSSDAGATSSRYAARSTSSRAYEDRGYPPPAPGSAPHPSTSSSARTYSRSASSRYDERPLDRYDERNNGRDSRSGESSRTRSPPPPAPPSASLFDPRGPDTRPRPSLRDPPAARDSPSTSTSTPSSGTPVEPQTGARSTYRDLSPPPSAVGSSRDDLPRSQVDSKEGAKPAPPPGKASYERTSMPKLAASRTDPTVRASSSSSQVARPREPNAAVEPGEVVPSRAATASGDAYDRRRQAYPSGSNESAAYATGRTTGSSGYDSRYSREPAWASSSAGAPSGSHASDRGPYRPSGPRGQSPNRTGSSAYPRGPGSASSRAPSPRRSDPHALSTAPTSSRRPRSPESSRRRRSSSSPRRSLHPASQPRSHQASQPHSHPYQHRSNAYTQAPRTRAPTAPRSNPSRRGRSPSRSPRSRSSSISPPPRTRRRRRGSSCSSASRSPSPPPPARTTASSRVDRPANRVPTGPRPTTAPSRGRSVSRSPRSPTSGSSDRTSRSTSRSPGRIDRSSRDDRSTLVPSKRRDRSQDRLSTDGRRRESSPHDGARDAGYDKKVKMSPHKSARPLPLATDRTYPSQPPSQPANHGHSSNSIEIGPTSRYPTAVAPASQRVPLASPASFERPFYPSTSHVASAPGLVGAPTGPRALRQPAPPGPATANTTATTTTTMSQSGHPDPANGFLPHGSKITVDIPKGPKAKAGFAPIKTTLVAGPPGSNGQGATAGGAAGSTTGTKRRDVKKFFPGEEEEEEEKRRARDDKEKEDRERAERVEREKETREKEKEKERERERELERDKERVRSSGRERDHRYRRDDRMDVDDDPRYAAGATSLSSSSRRERERDSGYRDRGRDSDRERDRLRDRSRDRDSYTDRRNRSRDRDAVDRDRDADGRNGWVVRNGGVVPPPRLRPLHDDDDHAARSATRGALTAPRGAPTAPSSDRRFAPPTGPASHARPPASYERPTGLAASRLSNPAPPMSSNAIPPINERKWGTPAKAAVSSTPAPAARAPEPVVEEKSGWVRSEKPEPVASTSAALPAPEERKEPTSSRTPATVQRSPVSTTPAPVSTDASAAPSQAATPVPGPVPDPPPPAVDAPAPPRPTELYERLVQVGEGTYGKVYKARDVETNKLVALKRIRMEAEKDGFPITAVREIKLLQSLRHRNVVDLIEMLVSKGHVYMVMEYMDHDLTGVLHHPTISFSPAHLKSLMKQFLEGLGFIHRRGVLHRDLKGSNILLSKHGELKIADFGLARFFARGRNNDYTNRVITQWYKPPELLFGATVYGEEVDMWSAGCIFLELFARRPVFQGQDEIHQLEVIFKVTGTPSVETWPGLQDLPWYELVKPKTTLPSQLRSMFSKWLSPAGLDVADRLLSLDPAGRPTADEALGMDYFTKEEPAPEVPDILSTVKGEWHEYESKKARRKARDEAA
ncbi:hypothetical protein JCM10212_006107 [Sporobolomyces blumeae]